MAVGDIYQVDAKLSDQVMNVSSVFGYVQLTGVDSALDAQILGKAWINTMHPLLQAMVADDVQFQCIYVRKVDSAGITYEEAFDNVFGSVVGNNAGNGQCAMISWTTNSNSSKDNGRTFIPGLSHADVENGQISGAFRAGPALAFVNAYVAPLAAVGPDLQTFQGVIIDRFTGGLKLVPPIAWHVVSGDTDIFVHTMRSRRTRQTCTALPIPV